MESGRRSYIVGQHPGPCSDEPCVCDPRCLMSFICCRAKLTICRLKLKGKLDISWLLLRQAVQLGQDLGFFQAPRTGHRRWRDTSVDMRSAGAVAAWGLFILNSYRF